MLLLCFSFVKQGLSLFVLSTRTRSVNLSFCCAIPKCRIERTTPKPASSIRKLCGDVDQRVWLLFSSMPITQMLLCSLLYGVPLSDDIQQNKKTNKNPKTEWNTKRRMTYIKKSKRNCYTQKLMACSQRVSFVSCVKLQHGAAQNAQKNQTLRECSFYINVCSSGWVVQWLDLLLFTNIVG